MFVAFHPRYAINGVNEVKARLFSMTNEKKTHILNAIGNQLKQLDKKVIFESIINLIRISTKGVN